jgi:hypothetical protein
MVTLPLKNLDVHTIFSGFSETLVRDGQVYVSAREAPLLVHCPPVRLASSLTAGDDDTQDFVLLKPKAALLDTFKVVEAQAIALAIANKATWFREDISEDTIAASFKSFVDGEAGTVRVRVSEALAVYDAGKALVSSPPPKGTRVRAVLELARITFGKTQFGLVWTLKQLKLADIPAACLFDDEDEDGTGAQQVAETLDDSILAAHDDDDLGELP